MKTIRTATPILDAHCDECGEAAIFVVRDDYSNSTGEPELVRLLCQRHLDILEERAELEDGEPTFFPEAESQAWISVEEQLPEPQVWVQGCCEHDGKQLVAPMFWRLGRWECEFTVTHWKPLDSPPKGNENV